MSSLPNPLITSSPERLGGTAVFELAKRALISPAA